jgi:small ligand-binding sensory domain FIST
LGLVYFTSALAPHAEDILALLKTRCRIDDWVGTCGQSIIASGAEYDSEPAISLMLLDLPPGSFQVFSGRRPPPPPGQVLADGSHAAVSALVHADPSTPDLTELIEDMAGKVEQGQLFGGIASGQPDPLPQIAHDVVQGGMSGVVFSSAVPVMLRVTQGCAPLAEPHVVSSCKSNLLRTLDGQPALDVLLGDLGVQEPVRSSRDGEALLRAVPAQHLRSGLMLGLASGEAPRRARPGFGDYVVRNLIGIDPHQRLVAMAALPREGDRIVLCTRNAQAAHGDLLRLCTELRDELETEGQQIRGAVYVSCLARGKALFGSTGAETGLIQSQLGEVPLVGFFANGEIAGNQLYGYTGVLTLFTGPAQE